MSYDIVQNSHQIIYSKTPLYAADFFFSTSSANSAASLLAFNTIRSIVSTKYRLFSILLANFSELSCRSPFFGLNLDPTISRNTSLSCSFWNGMADSATFTITRCSPGETYGGSANRPYDDVWKRNSDSSMPHSKVQRRADPFPASCQGWSALLLDWRRIWSRERHMNDPTLLLLRRILIPWMAVPPTMMMQMLGIVEMLIRMYYCSRNRAMKWSWHCERKRVGEW
jgi:hypothetical protein